MNKQRFSVTREELLNMRGRGMTNEMIARRLGCSPNTVALRLNPEAYERQLEANRKRSQARE